MRKERISVRAHESHSRKGKIERVDGFRESRNEPYPRGERLGVKLTHHPGYRIGSPNPYSPQKNAEIGIEYWRRRKAKWPALRAERQLNYLGLLFKRTNKTYSERAYAAAEVARSRHINDECHGNCRHGR